MQRLVWAFLFCGLTSPLAWGWAASGHHMVAVIAYDLMNPAQQREIMDLLHKHPQFDLHFRPPAGVTDRGSVERWQIGIAGCWPDIIRDTDYDRPTWHYELGASVVIGNVRPPSSPGPLPRGATMATQDLYLSQAVALCLDTFRDTSTADADRAVALCWLLHLFADGHQPCHAGSLYAPAFKDGDRGGNSIRLADGSNLHATWDKLLGNYPSANEVRGRVAALGEIRNTMMAEYRKSGEGDWLRPQTWLMESREASKAFVYTDEVTGPVIAASRGITNKVGPIKLSPAYYKAAGELAQYRIKQAGFRVGAVLVRSLAAPPMDRRKGKRDQSGSSSK